jgi:hypothetical protein
MSTPTVTRSFVQNLARNLKARVGVEVKHTDLIADIAAAFGRKPDALMHSLKQADSATAPEAAASAATPASLAPSELPLEASRREGYERLDAEVVDAALKAGFKLERTHDGREFWKKECGWLDSVFVAIGRYGDKPRMDAGYDDPEWKVWVELRDGANFSKFPIRYNRNDGRLGFKDALEISKVAVSAKPGEPASVRVNWGMDQAVFYLRHAFTKLFARARAAAGIDGEGDVRSFFNGHREEHAMFLALLALPPIDWNEEAPKGKDHDAFKVEARRIKDPRELSANQAYSLAIGFVADLADDLGIDRRPAIHHPRYQLELALATMIEDYIDFEFREPEPEAAVPGM